MIKTKTDLKYYLEQDAKALLLEDVRFIDMNAYLENVNIIEIHLKLILI